MLKYKKKGQIDCENNKKFIETHFFMFIWLTYDIPSCMDVFK